MMGQQMFEVEVPDGVFPGQAFQALIGGQLMLITCPEGAPPGTIIQVAGPSNALPTVAGVPVDPRTCSSTNAAVASGHPVPNQMYQMSGTHGSLDVGYVEVDEISPAGWMCLIVGCFACPGLNLLGLCMRERRLVPVTQVY